MRGLSSSDCLDLWERGRGLHPLDQALLSLASAMPEGQGNPADWPLGLRNQALAAVHRSSFGPNLHAWTSCTQCGEKLEFELDDRLIVKEEEPDAIPSTPVVVGEHRFRLPTGRDVAKAAGEQDPGLSVVRLVESCWLGTGVPPCWSDEDLEEIGEGMSSADPMAETRIALECPACGDNCDLMLDLPSFLWAEIEARARRTLSEIHLLASTYGWTEDEILSLSEARRSLYLEMVRT